MKSKAQITFVASAILLVAALLAVQSPESVAVAQPHDSTEGAGVGELLVPAQETICNSCDDCSTKLSSGSYVTVTLTTDLLNVEGSCVEIYGGESNVAFDCNGHTIDGDDRAVDPESGITMRRGINNKILNCTVSGFNYGIHLSSATNHTIVGNTTTSNDTGIYLFTSSNNDFHTNTSVDNNHGIFLEYSSDSNTINSNVICGNSGLDFALDSASTGNSGDNNTCDKPGVWNDQGTTGCTNLCAGTTTCNSCTDCTSKLSGIFDRVILTTDISNHTAGNCISFSASNIEFDCDRHTIDGDDFGIDYGVLISGQSGNTVENCTVTDFSRGIGMVIASDNIVQRNTTDSNALGIRLYSATGNTIYLNDAGSNTQYGIYLSDSSDNNTLYFNDLLCNDQGIRAFNSDSNTVRFNTVCSSGGSDISVSGSSGTLGSANRCDVTSGYNDPGETGCAYLCNSERCATCSDDTQNGNEEGMDCGGSYCPPCSQCTGESTNKYAPYDTVCNNKWPTSDGPNIGMNTTSDSCNLVEVCDPNLDYIIEDALTCCEHTDYSFRFTGHNRANSKIGACDYAHTRAYNGFFDANLNPTTLKQCLAHYIIRGFGNNAVYMQGYFDGELCCYGSDHCPSGCSEWCTCPPAWEMGTAASCAGSGGARPDFQMGGHRCEYNWAWFFGTHRWGEDGYWASDINWRSNNDSFADIPTHASINRLSTGTCVDYSFALTTMLRKAGYSKDDILSVYGDGHGYNLLRFPGESKWHYVDTVGNSGGGVYGGSGFPDPETAWYRYCRNMDEGCSNDVYNQSRSHCPSNSSIYGCESVVRLSSAGEAHPPTTEIEPASIWQYYTSPTEADQTCTELNPCTGVFTATAQLPGPSVDFGAHKEVSSEEITLGENVLVSIILDNHEEASINATVRETFSPGIDYDLDPQEESYEAFTFQYHAWNVTVPPQSTQMITFTATPETVGHHSFAPTSVFVNNDVYNTASHIVKVVCRPSGSCGSGETYIYCRQDCSTGIQDDYCDIVWDGRIDPDCEYAVDPDHNPQADTDGDGVVDGSDECPLTPAGEVVDPSGCACSQKICADEDPLTADRCSPTTAACDYFPDTDQDKVPDGEDNCPYDYNPEQHDSDDDGTGDQCEIDPVDANTILDGGTYSIYDYDLRGAIVITASNVTLDCSGATITGSGSGYGIYIPKGIENVTIQNCHISNYRYGIYVDSSVGNQLFNNTLQHNGFAIMLGYASNNTVSGNLANSNTQSGVYLEGSDSNQIVNNIMHTNGSLGIFVHTSSDNDISDNSVCYNTNSDFVLYESENVGDHNTCDQSGGWSDGGTVGCSNSCPQYIHLPIILKDYQP